MTVLASDLSSTTKGWHRLLASNLAQDGGCLFCSLGSCAGNMRHSDVLEVLCLGGVRLVQISLSKKSSRRKGELKN